MARGHDRLEMYHKGSLPSVFVRTSTSQPESVPSDTEFEEDMSDYEDYGGRRSEESVRYNDSSPAAFAEASSSLAIPPFPRSTSYGRLHRMIFKASTLGYPCIERSWMK